jgi:hypothetical protein
MELLPGDVPLPPALDTLSEAQVRHLVALLEAK